MPRARTNALFELGGQWIARIPSTPNLYRFWFDARSNRTCRASLGTEDLEAAKLLLAEIVVKGSPKTENAPLSAVLLDYFERRTDALPSAKNARLAGRTLLDCWGNTIRVGEITEAKQKTFVDWSAKRGHSLGYISRNLSVLAATLHFAKLDMEIIFAKATIQDKFRPDVKPTRKPFIPSDDEVARFFAVDMPEALFRWAMIALLTGARPEAVLDLTPSQRQRESGLIDLNPEGRPQNKKFRPIIRTGRILGGWLDDWEEEMEIEGRSKYVGYGSVDSLQTAMDRAKERAGLLRLSPYSFRHKVVTVLRVNRISEDEIAHLLGHRSDKLRTTLGYGEWSPDYLANATAALDDWIIRLQTRTKRVLLSLQPRTKDVLIPKNKRKLNASGTNTERPKNVIALK